MSFPRPFLSLRRGISFVLWAILCVYNRADTHVHLPQNLQLYQYLNSGDGSLASAFSRPRFLSAKQPVAAPEGTLS